MISYKINIVQALKNSGYNTNYIKTNKLFSESTMSKFRRNDSSITLNNINSVCKLLNCQPGDILEYIPDKE